jgi:hypothetical protein
MRDYSFFVAVSLLFAASIAFAEVRLNSYGHIIETLGPISPLSQHQVQTGNGLTVQFTFGGDGTSSMIKATDRQRSLIYSRSYRHIINLTIPPDNLYAAFFNGDSLVSLDLETGGETYYSGSVCFALDNEGTPISYIQSTKEVKYRGKSIQVPLPVVQINFWNGKPIIFTRTASYTMNQKGLALLSAFQDQFSEAKIIDDILYIVEKSNSGQHLQYTLYRIDNDWKSGIVDQIDYSQVEDFCDTHEGIRAPIHYYSNSFPSVVKNAYAQIQEWSNLYLHPGIDLFDSPYTPVYSVQRGVVKAILTTGDEQYWRIAISDVVRPSEGYLYAHLNHDSFVYAIGDTVPRGAVIGTIYPASSFSPHTHFARIRPAVGGLWNGNWWTVDNPLGDITNMIDTIPPVIENALGTQPFAFRNRYGAYLDPQNLSGEIKIIAKAVDYAAGAGFDCRIPIQDIGFKLYQASTPDSAYYKRLGFSMDMPLDTYFENSNVTLVLRTVYSRDAVCFSTNNNTNRDFFYIVTNSDGDKFLEPTDSLQSLDLDRLPPGPYFLKVTVEDASRNRTSRSMAINIVPPTDNAALWVGPDDQQLIEAYPNPFNPATTISFQLPAPTSVNLTIYDLQGSVIGIPYCNVLPAGEHNIPFDGSILPSGVYLYRLIAGESVASGKMVLLK